MVLGCNVGSHAAPLAKREGRAVVGRVIHSWLFLVLAFEGESVRWDGMGGKMQRCRVHMRR